MQLLLHLHFVLKFVGLIVKLCNLWCNLGKKKEKLLKNWESLFLEFQNWV